jgi:hypothetical protein
MRRAAPIVSRAVRWCALFAACTLGASPVGAQDRDPRWIPALAAGAGGGWTLSWWAGDGARPRPLDEDLALFEDDRDNHALTCPDSREPSADGAGTRGCEFPWSSAIEVAGIELLAIAVRSSHEHEGMYGMDEDVVLIDRRDRPIVVHTLNQWREDVSDCVSTLVQRRIATSDLDGDGQTDLCVESVEERGSGLFVVLDVQRWFPTSRSRGIDAFSYDAGRQRLYRRPTLDGSCPRTGYRPLVSTAPWPDPLAWRRRIQGEAPSSLREGPLWRLVDPRCAAP